VYFCRIIIYFSVIESSSMVWEGIRSMHGE
jgi:hypothetical protein